ncbi:MAG: tetratricopeptide repeat protein [Acidobacteria bacterium]|nr:tetratricopeptide repeat protein [Acidobacteriota bacterium]
MIGTTIGPYRVLRELGQGGMGTVVLAEDTRLGRHVALKTVSGAQAGTSGGRAQLLDEARAAAALTHPAIAAVHDVIEHDGNIAIVFELVEGETLAARLAKGPLPEALAVTIAVQIADALAVAHGARVLHRDLKPSNIMLAPGGVVKILDFGIARFRPVGHQAPAGKAGDEGFMGTPGYVAPEQWTGKAVDERADLYALGVVLFEMLTGKRPFPEREPFTLALAAIDRIARRVSSLRPAVSPALDKLVARLLAADPALRPPRARVVADELRSLLAPPLPPPPPPWKTWMAVAALVLAVGGGALWWWLRPVRLDVRNPVIAVLPLANETGDASSDYLAAGVADSLVTSLASFPAVTTLSRAMVADARARYSTPSAIARDLGATLLVDGTVQRQDDKLNIAISLVWPDGRIAWREAAEGPARDVFAIQARLASALVSALSVQMSADDEARLETPPTSNVHALDAYWRGRALLERRDTPGNLQLAEVAFKEALRLDARFVDAHVALSETYWELYNTTRDRRWVPQAQQESATVLALAPDVAAVRLALGITLTNSGRYGEAVQELQRALAIRPNDDEARRYLGKALAALDRTDEAVAEWRKALAVRPNNWQALSDMGRALFAKGRLVEAEAAYRQLIERNPDNVIGHQGLGTVLHRLKRIPEALASYERATAITPAAQTLSNMGTLYYERREYGKAVEAYRRAIALRPNSAPTHRNLGDLLTQIGRRDEALAAYQRAVELAEAAREVNPADAQNLAELAVYTVKTGNTPAALAHAAEATRLTPEAPAVWWLASHVYALAGRTEPALDALGKALAMGRAKADAREAQELASLRRHPAFQRLVAE